MAQLVGGDMAADLLQHRLGDAFAQCGVVGAGADLDDAARDHLAGARTPARAVGVEIDLKALLKPGEGRLEIEVRIGHCSPFRQRPPVLDLLLAPAARGFLEFGIVGENPAQMMGIGGAVVLDEARRLDDAYDIGVELIAVEAIPRNVVERPRSHAASSRQLGAQRLYTNEPSAMKSLSREAMEGLRHQRLISANAWSLAWATLCCRSSWRNSARRRARSVPAARATCSRRLGRLPSTACNSASSAARSSESGGIRS